MYGQGDIISAFRIMLDKGAITFACSATGPKYNTLKLSFEYGQEVDIASPPAADKTDHFLPAERQKSLTESELQLPMDLL